jgi:hypothetical protein
VSACKAVECSVGETLVFWGMELQCRKFRIQCFLCKHSLSSWIVPHLAPSPCIVYCSRLLWNLQLIKTWHGVLSVSARNSFFRFRHNLVFVRFQVLTATSMKFRIVFWDVLPCKIIVYLRFRGACCLQHQGWQLFYTSVHPRRQFWISQPCLIYQTHDNACTLFTWYEISIFLAFVVSFIRNIVIYRV